MRTTSTWPFSDAAHSAEPPQFPALTKSTCAPEDSNACTTSTWPPKDASHSAEVLLYPTRSTSALAVIRVSTISKWPFLHATYIYAGIMVVMDMNSGS